MIGKNKVMLWEPSAVMVVSDSTTDVKTIATAARQLRERERIQLVANFEAGHFEVASTFVWHRAMTILKKQLAKLGNEFIAELLQRPDIDNSTDIVSAISESEALSLAKDLGMLTPTQALRLSHSQEIVNHFASVDGDDELGLEETLTKEEAVSCLRVCIQGILGQEKIDVAENFAEFRRKLEEKTFTAESPEIVRLLQSPYFFVRTAISILLTTIRTGKGAELEHASRNALVIVPMLWKKLKKPERWQIGQAYAMEFNEGHKESVKALHAILLSVKGFDYVPENLRSITFTRVASAVVAAHQGINNFYNEAGPMRELAKLGSSIPGPALAQCVTAALCVSLGNQYGAAWNAQEAAQEVLASLSSDRWIYYFDERLEADELILNKLAGGGKPLQNWLSIISSLGIDPGQLKTKQIKQLIIDTNAKNSAKVAKTALTMLQAYG
jgi:hypothetical protein